MKLRALARLGADRRLTVVDYGVYSLTNFLAGVAVARTADLAVFGAYAVGFQVVNFVLVIARAFLGEAWLVGRATSDRAGSAAEARGIAALGLVSGIAAAPVVAAVTLVTTNVDGTTTLVLALAASAPALLVQDALRFVCFASDRTRLALASDVVWLVVQMSVVAAMAAGALPSTAAWAAGAWTIGAYAGVAAIFALSRVSPGSFAAGRAWLSANVATGRNLAAENLGMAMIGPLMTAALAAFASAGVVGAIRGVVVLFTPIQVFAQAMRTMFTRKQDGWMGAFARARMVLIGTVAAWTALLLVVHPLDRLMLGPLWGPTILALVPLQALIMVGLVSSALDSAQLRSRGATASAARINLALGSSVTVIAVACGVAWGAVGSAGSAAIVHAAGALLWLRRSYVVAARQGSASGTADIAAPLDIEMEDA